MAGARSYDDPCGTARALDVVGERWALLTVRELLFGPKRFGQLRRGLCGVSPNVLSQRLRELEEAGIVCRDVLAPPADVAVYRLTERGRALEPILVELGRWGSQERIASDNELSVDAMMLALKTTFVGSAARDAVYALQVAGEWFRVQVSAGALDVRRGPAADADVTLETDVATLRAVAFGRESLVDAERAGRLAVAGDRRAAQRFPRLFAVPGNSDAPRTPRRAR